MQITLVLYQTKQEIVFLEATCLLYILLKWRIKLKLFTKTSSSNFNTNLGALLVSIQYSVIQRIHIWALYVRLR